MELDQSGEASLAYLVHDLNDAAVRRRANLFAEGGVVVGVGGFRRHGEANSDASHPIVVDLGQTMDAQLLHRFRSVMKYLLEPGTIRDMCKGAPVIVARNLEMLVLAWRVRSPKQRLIYECLDVHRTMLGAGRKSRVLRWIERWLLARTDLVIVSSPAFARDYFSMRQGRHERVLLVENKVPVEMQLPVGTGRPPPDGKVWTIGWFGMLRCRRTLDQLATLARASGGKIKVLIAGIPSPAEFPDFVAYVAGCSGMDYLGPFQQADLPRLYSAVDFVWAIDYFEEGLNSNWLLPNRLYEGLASGVIPIALESVETGRWLARHGVGVLVRSALDDLPGLLASLTISDHRRMREMVAHLPQDVLYQTAIERREIVMAVAGRAHG